MTKDLFWRPFAGFVTACLSFVNVVQIFSRFPDCFFEVAKKICKCLCVGAHANSLGSRMCNRRPIILQASRDAQRLALDPCNTPVRRFVLANHGGTLISTY